MMVETQFQPFRKCRATSQTSAAFVSKVPTATEPTGTGSTATNASVVDLVDPSAKGAVGQNAAMILFYGTGSNNNQFSCRVIGWSCLTDDRGSSVTPSTNLWIPVVLAEVLVTLSSTPVGVAGRSIVATELFADTIAITGTTANAGVNIDVSSPANDTIARMNIDLAGFQKVEFSFQTGSSATDCNGLYRLL